MSQVVAIEDLVKTFPMKGSGGQGSGPVRALDGISLTIDEGQVLGLLGPNGSGKTTTVSILATLQRPDSGRVTVDGLDVVADARRVRERISLTGQYASLDGALTVRENIAMFGRLTGLPKSRVAARVDELVAAFALDEFIGRKVSTLSGGMRRRVDLAVALVTRPRVLFLDEPTTGLDPRSRAAVWESVAALRNDGIAVLLTTQYLEEADRLADSIVMLDHGRVAASGTAAELKQRAGEAICQITVESISDLPNVEAALGAFRRADTGDQQPGRPTYSVHAGDGLATMGAVVAALQSADVDVLDIALRRPSLDEVFLDLTAEADGTAKRSDDALEPAV
jgi:ABC-2 type transport system ATP-binding protein